MRTEASGQGKAEVLRSQRKAGCAPGPALGAQVSSGLKGSYYWLLQAWKVLLPIAGPALPQVGTSFHLFFPGPLLGNLGTFGLGLGWAWLSWR